MFERWAMLAGRRLVLAFLATVVVLMSVSGPADAEIVSSNERGFRVKREIHLPLTPEASYDVMTGDISGWWDHSFSDSPKAFYIEPRPGGGFYEIYDDEGNGVLHAKVIFAHRGKLLRFEGPLGLSGEALYMVTSWDYEPGESGTTVTVTVNATGWIEPGWDKAIDGLWQHFLVERLAPYAQTVHQDRAGDGDK